jgi:hypothetical protein
MLKIIAGLVLVIEFLIVSAFEVGFIGISILFIIGLGCLLILGSEFKIINDEESES